MTKITIARKSFLLGGVALNSLLFLGCSEEKVRVHPNVIIVMTDDQGFAEFSGNGNPIVRTPNLDALARQSIRLTDFHTAPMSTPTRGQLLTGCDAVRGGATNVSSGRSLLHQEFQTMGDIFGRAGYQTALVGKWHLGDGYPFRPQDRGFSHTLWFPSSHIGSVPDYWGNDYFDDVYYLGDERQKMEGYCTDVFFDDAMNWMDQVLQDRDPFLLCLMLNAPHGPFNAPEERVASVAERVARTELIGLSESRKMDLAKYLAMIECVDDKIAELISFIESRGISRNTVLVFLTDNGCVFNPYYASYPQRGKKAQLYEGGHRVPCYISYPGTLEGNRDISGLTEVQDLLPTLADLCNVTVGQSTDGISLRDVLSGKSKVPDRTLFINYSRMPTAFSYPSPFGSALVRENETAVLWRRWRLLPGGELYDLDTDPLQQDNVRNRFPEVYDRLVRERKQWWSRVGSSANKTEPLVIGAPGHETAELTSCDWMNVFVDQQAQVKKGTKRNSYWLLDVRRTGKYRFELRRWPRESGIGLSGAPQDGIPYEVRRARIFIGTEEGTVHQLTEVPHDATDVQFEAELKEGRAALHTWLLDAGNEPLFGAYYVYVTYLGEE